jgi:hypothetical protein
MKIDMDEVYFQQDGATCHTSNASMRVIESYFCDRLISKNMWPPRSPDLTPPDFFLWGLLKGRVYSNKPRTIDVLKDAIRREVAAIIDVTLLDVFDNLLTRIQKCLDARRGHALGRPCFATFKYTSIFIGNHTKIKKLLRNDWVS